MSRNACETLDSFDDLLEKGEVSEEDLQDLIKKCSEIEPWRNTIAIDFDGTVAKFLGTGLHGEFEYGDVLKGASEATRKLKEDGYMIVINTGRKDSSHLRKFLNENKIVYDDINKTPWIDIPAASDKVIAAVYLDDLNMEFDGNWSNIPEKVKNFRPWHKR